MILRKRCFDDWAAMATVSKSCFHVIDATSSRIIFTGWSENFDHQRVSKFPLHGFIFHREFYPDWLWWFLVNYKAVVYGVKLWLTLSSMKSDYIQKLLFVFFSFTNHGIRVTTWSRSILQPLDGSKILISISWYTLFIRSVM